VVAIYVLSVRGTDVLEDVSRTFLHQQEAVGHPVRENQMQFVYYCNKTLIFLHVNRFLIQISQSNTVF